MTRNQSASTTGMVIAGTVIIYLLWCAAWWIFTMDDAYIAWRYAANISDGLGPVWNPDPSDQYAAVEGYTSFLYVWLLALLHSVSGLSLFTLGKGLGIVGGLLLITSMVREIRREALGWQGALVALSCCLLPYTILLSVSGMETGLSLLLNWLCAITAVRTIETPTRGRVWLFVLFGLAATLTRPDFAAIFLVLAAYIFWQVPSLRRSSLLAGVLLYVLPGIAVTLWRLHVYGDFVPNTFHVKQGGHLNGWGIIYVLRFGIFVCLPYLLIAAAGWRTLWNDHRHLVIITALCIAIPGAYFTTVYPTMGWWYRFLLPQLPLLTLLAGIGIDAARDRAAGGLRHAPALGILLLVAGTLLHLPGILDHLPYRAADDARYTEIGLRLKPFRAPDRWLNFYDVGTVPYVSGWNTVDVVALNTRKQDLHSDCVMKNDVILRLRTSIPAEPHADIPNPCSKEPGLYVQLVDLPWVDQGADRYRYMRVFVRHDISYADALRTGLSTDWPAPYAPRTDFFYRFDQRFSRWLGR